MAIVDVFVLFECYRRIPTEQKGQAHGRNSEPGVSVLFECNEEYSQRKEQDLDPGW